MKTSNKLLLAAALIIFAYCVASAFALKKEYLKGDYKSRFYRMHRVNLTDFNAIEANVPNTNISIEQGNEFAVWLTNEYKEVEVSKKGKTLIINYKKNLPPSYGYNGNIVIVCPAVLSLKLGKALSIPEKLAITADLTKMKVDGALNTVKGFKESIMSVEINNAATVQLQQTGIGKFNGIANWGKLFITGPNKIDTADFEIRTHSSLELDYAEINHLTYKLDNTAKVTVSGESFKLLQAK